MTINAKHLRLRWAGGVHRFELSPHRWEEGEPRGLHDRARAVLGRLLDGTWGVTDIARTITCGLAYGGDLDRLAKPSVHDVRLDARGEVRRLRPVPWDAAEALVRDHVLARPLGDHVPLAQCILIAAIMGVPPEYADRERSADDALTAANA